MTVRLEAVTYRTTHPRAAGAFWAGLLGRDPVDEPGGILLPGDGTQIGLRFVTADGPAAERLHLHVTSDSDRDQQGAVDAVVRLGGRQRGNRAVPVGRDLYMADPDGNEFCLIEPGSTWLAGCGLLGEVTCEGGPATGRFWSEALGWPLVWAEGDQTAIQPPGGGTKISWDTSPETSVTRPTRQRFELVAADPSAEAERLVALGGRRRGATEAAVVLADPDGTELTIRRS